MPNLTKNYSFKKPQPNEYVKPDDFNDNWDVADEVFKEMDDKLNETISIEGGGTGATTADDARKKLGAASTALFNVSVDTSWTYDTENGGYYKDITVNGILESDTPIVDIVLDINIESNMAHIKAWSYVTRITTATNTIRLWANLRKPENAFTIQLKVVR